MAEFMNEQLTKSKRGRKPKATASSHFESDLPSTSSTTIRTKAELAEMAAALTHVPRDQWPDDVLSYQRDADRNRKRKAAEMQAEDDRLRREVEQQRRQEQLAKMTADEPEEDSRQPRQRSVEYGNRTKRQRKSEVDASNAVPADLMTDDEIEAACKAPLAAPNEELKQHIVNRTRAALSDANQGQRVCAVCDECVFKNESRLGPFCLSVERSLQQRCSAARQQPPLDATLIAQYDCSNVHRGFEGVLLSRTAFETAHSEVERANTSVADLPCVCGKQSHSATVYNVPMSICNSCASSLMRNASNDNNDDDDDDSAPAPPTFAIANGFAIGRLPPTLRDIRVHEAAMVAPSIVSGKRNTNNQPKQNRTHASNHNHTDHNRLR
jgi:hypothetical protein